MSLWVSLLLCFAVQLCLTTQLDSNSSQPEEEVTTAKPRIGGWYPVSSDQDEVKEAAKYIVTEYNARSRSRRLFNLVNMTEAQEWVDNTVIFRLQTFLGRTDCLKADNRHLDSCPAVENSMSKKCKFTVEYNPQNEEHEMLSHLCVQVP